MSSCPDTDIDPSNSASVFFDEGVKNLQLPVIVPKEILESSDLVAQVYFSVVNVLWYNFLTFRQVILGSISHHYLSLY